MNARTRLLAVPAVLALAASLAACGNSDGQTDEAATSPEPTREALSQGAYTATTEAGGTITLDVPADCPDDIAGAVPDSQDPIGCVKVTVDNTAGSDQVSPSGVAIASAEGEQLDYASASTTIGDWQDEDDSISQDLYNKYLSDPVIAGAKGESWFIGPEVPEQMNAVQVTDAMTPLDATPAA